MTDRLRWEDRPCGPEPQLWDGEKYQDILIAMAECERCPLLDPCKRAVADMQAAGLDLTGVIAAYPRGPETLNRYRLGVKRDPDAKPDDIPPDALTALQAVIDSIPHGTLDGARQERHNGLLLCRDCKKAEDESVRVSECGTDSAYRRHLRRGEPIDDKCRRAHNAKNAKYPKRYRKASA